MGFRGFRGRRRPGEAPAPKRPESTSPVGQCQICGRDQRVRDGVMVLHGYRRPGTGQTHGRCPGAGYPPYEFSVDRLREYVASLEAERARLAERIEEARSGRLQEITRYSRYTDGSIVFHPGDAAWPDELRKRIDRLDGEAAMIDGEILLQRRRLESWPGLRELTYVTDRERAARTRDPEKIAARAEAAAKREAERAEKEILAPDGSRLVVGGDPIRTKIAARNALSTAVQNLVVYGPQHRSNFPERIRILSEALAAAGIDPAPIAERARKKAESEKKR